MATRTAMAELIQRVRDLIGDPVSADQVFTNEEIQDALDQHRTAVRYADCQAEPVYAAGEWTYTIYWAPFQGWEDGVTLVDGTYEPLTVATAELLAGRFVLSASQTPPVLISGSAFDIYAAAADVLDEWAAKVARDFDFSADGSSFRRSQKRDALIAQAIVYRAKAKPVTRSILGD